jgi:hypothetical protein
LLLDHSHTLKTSTPHQKRAKAQFWEMSDSVTIGNEMNIPSKRSSFCPVPS